MRILLLTQLFQPEPNHLKGLKFAKELAKMGLEVEVLTGFPNYPHGRIYPGYRQQWRFKETMEGIPVVRVPLYPSHNSSGTLRFFSYISLMLTTIVPGLLLVKIPDVVHVYQGPATLALPAMLMRFFLRVPYVLDIQDLWPESVTSSGLLKVPWCVPILNLWCRLSYRYASKIIVLSPGYNNKLVARGVNPKKIEVVYNWCDESAISNPESREDVLKTFNSKDYFKVIYAGNLGPLQALDAVLDAADLLRRRNLAVRFVFVGDGADACRLKRKAIEGELTNVDFIPRQPAATAGCIIAAADSVLVHLGDNELGRVGIPQKVQAYMAAGKPIVLAMKGDAADLVRRANAGIICEPENPKSIASAIEALYRMQREERETLGRNGLEYYVKNNSFAAGVCRIATILDESTG